MAAFTVAPVTKEKRTAKVCIQADTIGEVVTRSFNIFLAGGEAIGATGDIGIKLPSGCLVLAAAIKCTEANANATTIALKTTTGGNIFGAATAPVNTGWTGMTVTTPIATGTGVEDGITATLAVGAIPAGGLNVQVSLVCASIDHAASSYATQNG